jgi:hypothetical protein
MGGTCFRVLARGLVSGGGNDYKKLLQPDEKLLTALEAEAQSFTFWLLNKSRMTMIEGLCLCGIN